MVKGIANLSRTFKVHAICTVIAAWFCVLPSYVEAQNSPEEFLSAILADDFAGDGGSRIKRVYYTDGKGEVISDCDCGWPRAIFLPWGDPVVFVLGWKFFEMRMERPEKATIFVRFTVLARTEGELAAYHDKDGKIIRTYRKIIPLPEPEEEIVVYRVWKIKGKWKLVDPPLPRISISSPVEKMHEEIKDYQRLLAREPDHKEWRDSMENYKEQLGVLEELQRRYGTPAVK